MRLIDRDTLWKKVTSKIEYCEDMLEIIKSMPIIEAEPVCEDAISRKGDDKEERSMKVVKIRHDEYGANGTYLFSTKKSLKDGDIVLVSTRNGDTVGWCVGDSKDIRKEDLEFLETIAPFRLPLKDVIGKMERWEDEKKPGGAKMDGAYDE